MDTHSNELENGDENKQDSSFDKSNEHVWSHDLHGSLADVKDGPIDGDLVEGLEVFIELNEIVDLRGRGCCAASSWISVGLRGTARGTLFTVVTDHLDYECLRILKCHASQVVNCSVKHAEQK